MCIRMRHLPNLILKREPGKVQIFSELRKLMHVFVMNNELDCSYVYCTVDVADIATIISEMAANVRMLEEKGNNTQ